MGGVVIIIKSKQVDYKPVVTLSNAWYRDDDNNEFTLYADDIPTFINCLKRVYGDLSFGHKCIYVEEL